jgi:hypothetical protein
MYIPIIKHKFEIIRYVGIGYEKNTCYYDKDVFQLEIINEFYQLEGSCKKTYSFQIINPNNNNYLKQVIKFENEYSKRCDIYEFINSNYVYLNNSHHYEKEKNNKFCLIL